LDKAILKAKALNMKLKKTATTIRIKKSKITLDSNKPYNAKRMPRPNNTLKDREVATPKNCPKNIDRLLMGCAKSSSVNSCES
jgi:hypothetical protein